MNFANRETLRVSFFLVNDKIKTFPLLLRENPVMRLVW